MKRHARTPRHAGLGEHLRRSVGRLDGQGEIRTLDTGFTGMPVFETGAFNHSATCPTEPSKLVRQKTMVNACRRLANLDRGVVSGLARKLDLIRDRAPLAALHDEPHSPALHLGNKPRFGTVQREHVRPKYPDPPVGG